MNRYAVLDKNIVSNIVALKEPKVGFILIPERPDGYDPVSIGFEYKEGKFGNPEKEDFINGEWVLKPIPAIPLDQVKKQKKAEIKSAYENARNDGGDGIFSQVLQAQIDCRADDVLNIKSIVDFKEATGSPQPDFYKLKDNTHFSPCTLEMFKQVYTELIVGQLTWWNKKDMLEKQIDEAQTTEKVQAISWNPIEGESLTV
jgi:hypothetical protein